MLKKSIVQLSISCSCAFLCGRDWGFLSLAHQYWGAGVQMLLWKPLHLTVIRNLTLRSLCSHIAISWKKDACHWIYATRGSCSKCQSNVAHLGNPLCTCCLSRYALMVSGLDTGILLWMKSWIIISKRHPSTPIELQWQFLNSGIFQTLLSSNNASSYKNALHPILRPPQLLSQTVSLTTCEEFAWSSRVKWNFLIHEALQCSSDMHSLHSWCQKQ